MSEIHRHRVVESREIMEGKYEKQLFTYAQCFTFVFVHYFLSEQQKKGRYALTLETVQDCASFFSSFLLPDA